MTKTTVIADLNVHWRVVAHEGDVQWILQRKHKPANKVWFERSFCVTREALLRCVREHCGAVDWAAYKVLEALPERHH